MAHYANDCWDGEIETSYGWVECVGLADRSAYDLTAHAKMSKIDLNAYEKFPEPRMVDLLKVGGGGECVGRGRKCGESVEGVGVEGCEKVSQCGAECGRGACVTPTPLHM